MIYAIFAVDDYDGFGKNGTLPWGKIKEDMQWFVSNTKNSIVVMGHNTWNSEDMPSPLPGRENYVIGDCGLLEGATVISDSPINKIQELDRTSEKDVYVIGGKRVLEGCAGIYDRVLVTRVRGNYRADVTLDVEVVTSGLSLIEIKRLSKNITVEIYG